MGIRKRTRRRLGRRGRADQTELEEALAELRERVFRKALKSHFAGQSDKKLRRRDERARDWINIVGIGIGEKETENMYVGEQALTIFVETKMPRSKLRRALQIPKTIGGIPTDLVETGRALATQSPASRTCLSKPNSRQPRPFPSGVSIGGGTNGAGSCGYLVRRISDGADCVLSNYHVLGDLDRPGEELPVFQPGFGDGMVDPDDRVGFFLEGPSLDFTGAPNAMDAAIASVSGGMVLPELCSIGEITGTVALAQDDTVVMFGKTSRYSKGFVKDLRVDVVVGYGRRRKALLADQVLIVAQPPNKRFAQGGDSGSLVVKESGLAGALVVATVRGTRRMPVPSTFATPIARVLDQLGVELVV